MDYKKTNAPINTVTRDMVKLSEDTGNVYETVAIIAKRANQIAGQMKHDLEKKTSGIRVDERLAGRGFGKPRADRDFPLLREITQTHTDRRTRV